MIKSIIHIFSQDSTGLVKKLKNLKQNQAALESLKAKLNSATSRDASTRAVTCTELATTTSTVISLIAQNPVSYTIFTLIQTVLKLTFSCTPAEKEALKAVSASVDEAISMVTLEVTHIQTTIICKFLLIWD
jgi:hypothetical protein